MLTLGTLGKVWKTRSRKTAQRGATAVEMALIVPMFMMLIVGITETTMIEAAQQIMENAAYNTSRLAKTGYAASGESQAQTVNQIMVNELGSFGSFFDITKITMTSTAYNSFSSIGTGGAAGLGTAQQIVVYTITYPWKLFTPLIGDIMGDAYGNINLTARIVVHNEPYSS
jgi:Flp pilus assembly protein TadG